ncbi:MAG: zeta toxin family protein [Bacteroidetes bacterium]|nr:zeta toxin family protein [Bacteroidota bacterium]
MQPRFRMFAGPNGSGKTHLFNFLRSKSYIHTEIYVNADEIEQKLSESLRFHFNAYRVKVSDEDFKKHIRQSGILKKIQDKSFLKKINIQGGVLKMNIRKGELNSYIASFIASYLSEKLIESKQSFCYETVLSHPSKLKLLEQARKKGYKTYCYFVFTNDWHLNIERVKLRVKQGGHDVDDKKIEQRYFRSLKLFSKTAKASASAYLIDNSTNFETMAELRNGKNIFTAPNYPKWLKKYYAPE